MGIRENILRVRERIEAACRTAGRNPQEVHLVAVSKTVSAERVEEAIASGIATFGENRVQEAASKIPRVRSPLPLSWHMIGHLQRNKAKLALDLFDVIESVDNVKLAKDLDRHAAALGRVVPVLLQINIGDEGSKAGVAPAEAQRLAEEIVRLEHLRLRGLMTIPPFTDNPEAARPFFAALRELRDTISATVGVLPELSMGMSHDFDRAIIEGATIVRVGTVIFGKR